MPSHVVCCGFCDGSLRARRWPIGHRPPPLRRLGLWPGGDLCDGLVATCRPLRERVLRTLPVSASIVTLARAIGKYQFDLQTAVSTSKPVRVLHWAPIGRGVTGVPPTDSSPTVSRRELGTLLRGLRIQKGWTAEQVAERLMVTPSKVSRLETGKRGASVRDIRDLSNLYEVDDETRPQLLE